MMINVRGAGCGGDTLEAVIADIANDHCWNWGHAARSCCSLLLKTKVHCKILILLMKNPCSTHLSAFVELTMAKVGTRTAPMVFIGLLFTTFVNECNY